MKKIISILFVLITMLFHSAFAENITGFDGKLQKAQKTFYVGVNGVGDGSKKAPLGSIQKAIELALEYRASNNKTVRVEIADGLYREKVSIAKKMDAQSNAQLIISAAPKATVTLSGAVVLPHLEPIEPGGKKRLIYRVALTDEMISTLTQNDKRIAVDGEVKNPWEKYVKKMGGMFQNGLLRVGNHYYYPKVSADSLVIGSFSIDYTKKLLHVFLIDKANLEDAELATLPTIFSLSMNDNIVLKGLNFEMGGWSMTKAVNLSDINNLKVEDCRFNNNRYAGLTIHKIKNATFQNVQMNNNGGSGGAGSWQGYLRNIVFDGLQVNANNWINAHYMWYGWDPCGMKFSAVRGLVIRNAEFKGNFSVGLWLDTQCNDFYVYDTKMNDNIAAGTMIEANKGPVVFTRCEMVNNDWGVYISASELTTLDGCKIKNNNFQIGAFDHWAKGRGHGGTGFDLDFADIDTKGEWSAHAVNTVVKNCQISNQPYNTAPLFSPRYNDIPGYQNFLNTLTIENNTYEFGASGKSPFLKDAKMPESAKGKWEEN